MKRTIAIIMSIMFAFAFSFAATGCGNNEEKELPEENVDYEIALVTDDGLIMDGGHSEVAWNTITEFGSTKGISHKYYKATEPTEGAFVETIKLAINKGANNTEAIIDNGTDAAGTTTASTLNNVKKATVKTQDKTKLMSIVVGATGSGNITLKRAPQPGVLSMSMRPPIAAASSWLIASPSPLPP